MGNVISNARSIDSVLLWYLHQGFNIDVVTLTAHTGGIAVGANMLGWLAFFSGGVWKNVIAADTITQGTTILGVILRRDLILSAVTAGNTITKVPLLTRGPALVHDDGLDYTAHTKSVVQATLLDRQIKVVDENGLAFTNIQD